MTSSTRAVFRAFWKLTSPAADRAVLEAICSRFAGTVGLTDPGFATIGEEAETVETVAEPYLCASGSWAPTGNRQGMGPLATCPGAGRWSSSTRE